LVAGIQSGCPRLNSIHPIKDIFMIFSTTTNAQAIEILVLYDGMRGHSAHRAFYDSIRREILDIAPALIPGEGYTAEMLCGPEFWCQLSDNEQRLAGRCVAHMVRNGLLPLIRLDCRHKSPARYTPR
jgi:hypothetical protein